MIEASFVTAAGGELPFLQEMVAMFAIASLLVFLCQRLKLVSIVGFLLTGVLIGPYALGLVRDLDLISSTAQVGVILLLFTIGVEFSVEKLSRIRRYIVLGGGLQVAATVGLVALLLAVIFYFRGRYLKEPVWGIDSNNLIAGSEMRIEHFDIWYRKRPVENLTVSKIWFWN